MPFILCIFVDSPSANVQGKFIHEAGASARHQWRSRAGIMSRNLNIFLTQAPKRVQTRCPLCHSAVSQIAQPGCQQINIQSRVAAVNLATLVSGLACFQKLKTRAPPFPRVSEASLHLHYPICLQH
jgi:hypothetical protein